MVTRTECGSKCGSEWVVRLSASAVKAARTPGRFGDGDGLYLLVGPTGGKSWVVRVQKDARRRDIGLGSEKKVSLAQARKLAAEVRSQVQARIDPIAEPASRTCREADIGWTQSHSKRARTPIALQVAKLKKLLAEARPLQKSSQVQHFPRTGRGATPLSSLRATS